MINGEGSCGGSGGGGGSSSSGGADVKPDIKPAVANLAAADQMVRAPTPSGGLAPLTPVFIHGLASEASLKYNNAHGKVMHFTASGRYKVQIVAPAEYAKQELLLKPSNIFRRRPGM